MTGTTRSTPTRTSRVRVRYAETDRMGVVYYANYLVWFEVGRTEWLRETGWTYREMEQEGIALPVIEAHCEYRQPARYDDDIEIRTRAAPVDAHPDPVRLRPRPRRSRGRRIRLHDSRGARRDGPRLSIAGAGHGIPRVKALVTGVAGFIGSHLAERLLDAGADGHRPRLLQQLLPAGPEGSQRRGAAAAPRGSPSSRPAWPTPTSRGSSMGSRTCSTWRPRPGCAKAGDAIFASIQ